MLDLMRGGPGPQFVYTESGLHARLHAQRAREPLEADPRSHPLDRFFMKLSLGYPETDDEKRILYDQASGHPIHSIEAITDTRALVELQDRVGDVHVDDTVADYIVTLTRSTRNHPDVALGSSTRGSLALFRASQGIAAVRGRDYVLPDDVKEVARDILTHRILVDPESVLRGISAEDITNTVLAETEVVLAT